MDTQSLLAGMLATVVVLAVLGQATALSDRVDGIIRLIAVGSFVGTTIAYRRRQRRPDFDPFPIITRWSYVGLVVALLLVAWGVL